MTFEPYRYERPTTVEEACALLAEPGAVALAGGTDLLLEMRLRERRPSLVVDLKSLPTPRGVAVTQDRVEIGALTTVTDLLHDEIVADTYPCLVDAARVFACAEIRHRATLGGNLANASPGAEFTVPLMALDADVVVANTDGVRTEPLATFLRGPGRTTLQPGELIAGVSIPLREVEHRCAYVRRARTRGMDLASVSLAVVVHGADDPAAREVAISMGAVAPVPPLPASTEAMLSGCAIDEALLHRAGRDLVADLAPRASSLRATPGYKLAVLPALLGRTLRGLGVVEP